MHLSQWCTSTTTLSAKHSINQLFFRQFFWDPTSWHFPISQLLDDFMDPWLQKIKFHSRIIKFAPFIILNQHVNVCNVIFCCCTMFYLYSDKHAGGGNVSTFLFWTYLTFATFLISVLGIYNNVQVYRFLPFIITILKKQNSKTKLYTISFSSCYELQNVMQIFISSGVLLPLHYFVLYNSFSFSWWYDKIHIDLLPAKDQKKIVFKLFSFNLFPEIQSKHQCY